MRYETSIFFMLLAEHLAGFMILIILGGSDEVAIVLAGILFISFLASYTQAYIYPKLIDKYGEQHYKLILLFQYIFLSNSLYIIGLLLSRMVDGVIISSYIKFMIICTGFATISYQMNKKLLMNEIKYLNNKIKMNR